MKKILITGANSYIGTSFERYIKENYPDDYTVDTIDMVDGSWRAKSFAGYDTVFHVAGIAHQKETKKNAHLYYEINRDLTIETAKKAKEDGVKQFIFLSSMSVYGMDTGVITQKTVPNPKSNYGKSKLQAEIEILKFMSKDFQVTILRPPMVYGKYCRGNYNTLKKIALKSPIFPQVKNQRSMIYIDNLCQFIYWMIENKENGIFFPQNSEYINTTDLVHEILLAHQKNIHPTKIFNWLLSIASLFTNKINKSFGSLIYDCDMSAYRNEYQIVNFHMSIQVTEGLPGGEHANH